MALLGTMTNLMPLHSPYITIPASLSTITLCAALSTRLHFALIRIHVPGCMVEGALSTNCYYGLVPEHRLQTAAALVRSKGVCGGEMDVRGNRAQAEGIVLLKSSPKHNLQ